MRQNSEYFAIILILLISINFYYFNRNELILESVTCILCDMKMTETPPDFNLKLNEIASSSRFIDILPLLSSERLGMGSYYHWEELAYRDAPNDLNRDEWWIALKLCRHAQSRKTMIPFRSDSVFWWTMPDLLIKRLHDIDIKAGVTVRSDAKKIVADSSTEYLRGISSLFEAVTSSQLEGAPTTWSDAKRMIRTKSAPRDLGERMIFNNYKAMQRIIEIRNQPLTVDVIKELHYTLTENTLDKPDTAGRFRREDEFVRVADDETIFHLPPHASRLSADMAALCAFANGESVDGMYMPDIIKAIVLHFWLAYEHPFCDGNGRVARALMYWSLLRSGYSIFEFVSISNILKKAPSKYVRAFTYTETDEGDLTYFLLHHSEAILRALDEFHAYIKRKAQKIQDAESLLDGGRFNQRERAVLVRALRNPGYPIRIADCQQWCAVSYATARSVMMGLQNKGLVEMRKESYAFAYYPVSNLSDRLNECR